jgi:16S rRNA G1207 methylase RsmC
MSRVKVNAAELKEIAKKATAERAVEKTRKQMQAKETKRKEGDSVKKRADEIIASIPKALKKAAARAKRKNGKLVITTKIFIAGERMTSIMSSRGYLDSYDARILREVRRKMKALRIKGVKISEARHTQIRQFMATDCTESSPGPCVSYYLKAQMAI